ncbi:methyltransferase [Cladophialophora carrionii]|uniref:Methyltransferase n=1 Tax=Cladophialophora carrionii TaxID=86049 RepID=A0A1C1CL44_9EURO|nr:methyltransferase [Cladophialophora carrionii]
MASAVSSLSAGNGNERFNAEAANWDKNPFVHEASKQASKAIIQQFPALQNAPGRDKLDILEIGCGTGLLSCMLAPHARHYVAVDAAQGMIDVLKSKMERSDTPQNIIPVAVLLEDPEDHHLPPADEKEPDGKRLKFDLITSHLVLHHIQDLKAVLTTMLGCLKDGGSVALTDFEDTGPESKRFHPQSKMGGVERHGIHAETMEALMNEVGFVNVRVKAAWSMDKTVEKFEGEFGADAKSRKPDQGVTQSFPFVLCIGERKYCQSSDGS